MGFLLNTERLTLRDYEVNDYGLVREVFLNPALAAFHLSNQASEAYVNEHFAFGRMQTRWQPRLAYDLALVSATGETLGLGGLKRDRRQPDCGQINWHIRPAHWNQGYATEAAARLLAFGFTELQFVAIEATAFANNAASIRVMEKIGLQPAQNNGTASWWRGLTLGEARPVVRYALTMTEWLATPLGARASPLAVKKAA